MQKAERYRLLNDSSAAESICLDILEIEPENQQALITLLLSITDQFGDGDCTDPGEKCVPRGDPGRGFQLRGHSLALYADCTKPECPYRKDLGGVE